MIKFTWDIPKSQSNFKKHGVSFEEAKSIFYDDFAIQFYDDPHSQDEDRFLILGLSNQSRLLLICHCERDAGHSIRIISARKSTNEESKHYSKECV